MKRRSIVSRSDIFAILITIAVLTLSATAAIRPKITRESFGKTAAGTSVEIFTLTNGKGVEARIMTLGGTVVSLKVPDKFGKLADVVLGCDSVADYEKATFYFGALVGRYANRIAKGRFSLGGKDYSLAINNGENHLHGGIRGFDKVVWTAATSSDAQGDHLSLSYLSRDGEEGYPGNLNITVVYTLTEKNELKIEYSATTDKATVINLTHHSYFNLAGPGHGDILHHVATIYAKTFTPTDAGSIPTGELRKVAGTPFDFTKPREIGSRISDTDEQLKFGNGYDHNWVLDKAPGKLGLAATVYEPKSGRRLGVFTTEPGIQFYTGNYLDGVLRGKSGAIYPRRSGFCLEAQHFPDSPNQPTFPTTQLLPEQRYTQTTIYKFSVR
ncbi:MAG: aldose epimerase family protein [Acidobacteriota bacterium]